MDKMVIQDESELATVAQHVLDRLTTEERDGSRVLALHGDLGSGKTAFVKVLAHMLGVKEDVTSPTFVILKIYPLDKNTRFGSLAHIDAYRIEDIDEMRPVRFDELLKEKDVLVCIEWAEKIAALLPPHTLHMTIAIEGEHRVITFT